MASESTPKFKPLSNSNYPEWRGEMKAWLMKNGLWRLVSGREPKPKTEEGGLSKWEGRAERAAGEIFLSVENDQRVHFRGSEEDPIEIWGLLEKAHLSKKPGARFNAYDDLFSIQKESTESLVDLGVRIEKAMANIQNLRPNDFTIETLDKELQCMALIRALPEDYRYLSSSLLLLDNLDKHVIMQAFRSEELNRQRQSEMVNRAKANLNGYRGGSSSKPDFKDVTCYGCGAKGHFARWPGCPLNKDKSGSEGAKKVEEEKQAETTPVTECAGKASAVSEFEANSTSSNVFDWNTDTGATSHMTPHRNWIRNYKSYRVPIKLADERIIYSEGVGTVVFRPIINGHLSRDVEFSRVLHVPALRNNLLAVLYLTRYKEFDVHISCNSMDFIRNDTTLFTATINSEGIGYLDGSTISISESVHLVSTLPLDLTLWHRRLGHLNHDSIKKMLKHDLVTGLTMETLAKPDPICEPCLAGKMHANPFPSSSNRAEEVLELIHSDLHHIGITSHGGHNYWITFIDDCSRLKAAVPLKRKSDAFDAFKQFKAYAENQTGKKIKKFRYDKGGEYMSNEFIEFLDSCGIEKQYTVRNRPQQNGVAERANRTLAERITAMLDESGLSKRYWAECLAALVHVLNCCPTAAVTDATPYQLWNGKKPDIGHLRVWGCVAYVNVQRDKHPSLGSHMDKCIFIGYPDGYKGWKFYNPKTKKVIISERADFDERYTFDGVPIQTKDHFVQEPSYRELIPVQVVDNSDEPAIVEPPAQQHPKPEPIAQPKPVPEDIIEEEEEVDHRPIAVRKPKRNVKPPGWWKVREPTPAISDSEEESNDDEQVYAAGEVEPQTYGQAVKGPDAMKWNEAMLEEYNAHLANGTWTIVKLPPGQMIVASKWVYRIKHNADGSIERFKARLVAKGFSQRPGIDYFETFASTMRHATIRIVLALAAIEDLHLRSVDVSHAFINSEIDTEVYMAQPCGFVQQGPEYVCKLNKSIYGLKQSPRLWGEKLGSAMNDLGFIKAYSDPSLYIYDRDNVKVIVPVFVDDITLASKSDEALDKFVAELGTYFKLRDLGSTSLLLGVEITRNRAKRTIYLSQRQYILNKLDEFSMTDCKPVSTPMLPGLKLTSEQCPQTSEDKEEMKKHPYINAVGSLLYLAILTRPDIAFAAGVLARFNSNPGITHWKAVKHLFRYLKSTVDLKLAYGPDPSMDKDRFITYCDADHGGNKDNGKSTSGYMVKLGSGVVCWSSKLQPIVTLSTTEAEYVAGVAAGKEICWVQNLLGELGYIAPAPSKLYTDNQSALSVAKNPEHGRMKHLALCFYWLRDKVQSNILQPLYLRTEDMPADLLTKALPRPQVEKLRSMMGLVNGDEGVVVE